MIKELKGISASILAGALLLSGCNGGGSSNAETTTETPSASVSLSGSATKGTLSDAVVLVSQYESGQWVEVGRTVTDALGNYSLSLSSASPGLFRVQIQNNPEGETQMVCDWGRGCGAFPEGAPAALDANEDGLVNFGESLPIGEDFELSAWVYVSDTTRALNTHVSALTTLLVNQLEAAGDYSQEALNNANRTLADDLGIEGLITELRAMSPAMLQDNFDENNTPSTQSILYGAVNAGVIGSYESFESFLQAFSSTDGVNRFLLATDSEQATLAPRDLLTKGRQALRVVDGKNEILDGLIDEITATLLAKDGETGPVDLTDLEISPGKGKGKGKGEETFEPLSDVDRARAFMQEIRQAFVLSEAQLPTWQSDFDQAGASLVAAQGLLKSDVVDGVVAFREIADALAENVDPENLTDFNFTRGAVVYTGTYTAVEDIALSQYVLTLTALGVSETGADIDVAIDILLDQENVNPYANAHTYYWYSRFFVDGDSSISGTVVSGDTTLEITQANELSLTRTEYNYGGTDNQDIAFAIDLKVTLTRVGDSPMQFEGRIRAEWFVPHFWGTPYDEGEWLGQHLENFLINGEITVGEQAGVRLNIAMTGVDGYYDRYSSNSYYSLYESGSESLTGHLVLAASIDTAEDALGVSVSGDLNYWRDFYRNEYYWNSYYNYSYENGETDFSLDGLSFTFDLGEQSFRYEAANIDELSSDEFCNDDSTLYKITNQDGVSLYFNISELCNFGKLAIGDDPVRNVGYLEERDGNWIIGFFDGSFETLF